MRVAVLSDLHANALALEAVMKDVINQKCEHVFCLGDLALAGPQPKEVVEYVMNQDTWTVIQGNTDKMIAQYGPDVIEFLEEQYPVMANAIADDVTILNDIHRAYLNNLPPMLQLEIEGCSVLLVHGSPRANNEDILPNMPLEKIEEIPLDQEKIRNMPGITVYIMKPGDTLWNIAKKFYTTVEEIIQMNNLDGDEVSSGTPLLLVKKVEE